MSVIKTNVCHIVRIYKDKTDFKDEKDSSSRLQKKWDIFK